MVNGGDRVMDQSGQGDEMVMLKQHVTRLTQACLAADALISSLLAIREGATDALLIEVRDFLRAAVAYREQKEG
ncbi:MAG: hypothetical protein DYG89_04195 [Caldilinea sp. CFX5]|nr:hypothetical protein [Caldilinea sp. CFX5]